MYRHSEMYSTRSDLTTRIVLSKFEILGGGFRYVDVLTEVAGSLQTGTVTVQSQVIVNVWVYPFSNVFDGIYPTDFYVSNGIESVAYLMYFKIFVLLMVILKTTLVAMWLMEESFHVIFSILSVESVRSSTKSTQLNVSFSLLKIDC